MSILKQNVAMAPYTTFGVAANAKYFIKITTEDSLAELLKDERLNNLPILPLGGGSNILFTTDYNGCVIKNDIQHIALTELEGNKKLVKVGGGYNWHQFVLYTIEKNLYGLENLSLIPGTVGAAPIQNIGAYGVEQKDCFHSLRAFNLKEHYFKTFSKEDCQFGYRDSFFKNEGLGNWLITEVCYELSTEGECNTSYGAIQQTLAAKNLTHIGPKEVSDAVIEIRESKLPNPKVIGNGGSFFKNPVVPKTKVNELKNDFPNIPFYDQADPTLLKVPAGWLIDQCGWKGFRDGDVGVYEKQALVLVNYGEGSGQEVINLANKIKNSVYKKFGIELEMEVRIF